MIMNTMKSLFAASLLAIASSSAMAQATYTDQNGDEYTFNKHWFLDLQGGAQSVSYTHLTLPTICSV